MPFSPSHLVSPALTDQAADAGIDGGQAGTQPTLRLSGDPQVRRYASHFADLMEMRAPADVVGRYLDRHEDWFRRCAAPMTVASLDRDAYLLTLGRFGNFGFEVEPTIALELLPQENGVYEIVTLPLADQSANLQGLYDVDFNASLRLDETDGQSLSASGPIEVSNEEVDLLMSHTLVRWQLDLAVWIRLPSMLNLLPDGLVQSSGDHLLKQIVRQISRKLTWKVQEDFHANHGIPCPPRRRARF